MMGGPPPSRISKPPPLPTPGRDIAGEEAVATSYSGARRRGDEHKKSTYDSDDVDRNQDSDLESDRDREPRYPAPRRTVSPGKFNLGGIRYRKVVLLDLFFSQIYYCRYLKECWKRHGLGLLTYGTIKAT